MNTWIRSLHLSCVLSIFCLLLVGCEDTDIGMATQAGVDALRAATLDDQDVRRLSLAVSRQSDQTHTVAPPQNPYARRLKRLTESHQDASGNPFNFKVYLSPTVNAFAVADGSIRICSGLMDMMDDDEFLFVIGHEMGHIEEKHVKEKIRLAYAGSAVRKAIASQQNQVGAIARSGIGTLAETLLNAQFSQREERQADDYGVAYLKNRGYGIRPAVSALTKLATLGNDHSFLASHPAPKARAERLRANADAPQQMKDPSRIQRIVDWLKNLWPFHRKERKT
ncbi:MAG: M48 family metallopeptidase [Desulfobacterales bacterium]|nr:M48 family metallopeptidase [Desulfobacterales bacterium]